MRASARAEGQFQDRRTQCGVHQEGPLSNVALIAATRITLTNGSTIVVKGTVEDVKQALASPSGPDAAHLEPVALGSERPPDVIALKLGDVRMLADATPWGNEAEAP